MTPDEFFCALDEMIHVAFNRGHLEHPDACIFVSEEIAHYYEVPAEYRGFRVHAKWYLPPLSVCVGYPVWEYN